MPTNERKFTSCYDESNKTTDGSVGSVSRQVNNYLDFLVDNTQKRDDIIIGEKKKSKKKRNERKPSEYSEHEDIDDLLDIFSTNETKIEKSPHPINVKRKREKRVKYSEDIDCKESGGGGMFDYSPSEPTQDDDIFEVVPTTTNNNKKYKKYVQEHQHRALSSPIEMSPEPTDDHMISTKVMKRRMKVECSSMYSDVFPTLIADSDISLARSSGDAFDHDKRTAYNDTDNLFSDQLKMMINESSVPAFVVSDKSFRADSLSPNICFMWTLICSLKYDRQKDNNKVRTKSPYERALIKQFRKEAENRILYAGEEKIDYEDFNSSLLNSFLNDEYYKIVGRKSELFLDLIKRDTYTTFPISKRVLSMISSLPSIKKFLKLADRSTEYDDNRAKATRDGRIGIPLIDKSRRRKLASREDTDMINCIEIEDDDDNKDKYRRSSTTSGRYHYNESREHRYRRSPPRKELPHKKTAPAEKTPSERIAELKRMLPMIGKKPIKKSKNVKSLLEQARLKNSVPHKPGPYQFNTNLPTASPTVIKPAVTPSTVFVEPRNIEMQISDESDSPRIDAAPESSVPQPPLPALQQRNLKKPNPVTHSPNLSTHTPPPPPPPPPEVELQGDNEVLAVKKCQPIPFPVGKQNKESIIAAENASKMADSMIGQQSTGVKQQLEAMAAFLNRGNETKKEEVSQPTTNDTTSYEYLNANDNDTQIIQPVDPNAYWQEKSGITTQDYWNNYNYQDCQNESYPPMNGDMMNFNQPPMDTYIETVPDIEWYECKYVETSEYTGIEPPIPGHQRVILPPLPGIPSTDHTPSADTSIICKAIEVPVKDEKEKDDTDIPVTTEPAKVEETESTINVEESKSTTEIVPVAVQSEQKQGSDWTENIRMFVFKTEKTICQMAETILFEMGIQNLYPEDLKSLPYNAQFQIFVHKPDILEIDRIPNLAALKNDHRVYFLRFSDIEDIKKYKSEPLLTSGGQIIIDDPGLMLTTPVYLQHLLNFMESQTLGSHYWSLKIHADSMQALAMKTAEDEGVRESSIYLMLTSPQYAHASPDIPAIVEVLTACHVPACTGQPCTTSEYLDCLRALQVVNIERHRETYLFTDQRIHNDDNGEFKAAGITLTNIEEFIRNISGL